MAVKCQILLLLPFFKLRSPYTNNLEQFRTVPAEKGHLFRSAVDSLHWVREGLWCITVISPFSITWTQSESQLQWQIELSRACMYSHHDGVARVRWWPGHRQRWCCLAAEAAVSTGQCWERERERERREACDDPASAAGSRSSRRARSADQRTEGVPRICVWRRRPRRVTLYRPRPYLLRPIYVLKLTYILTHLLACIHAYM